MSVHSDAVYPVLLGQRAHVHPPARGGDAGACCSLRCIVEVDPPAAGALAQPPAAVSVSEVQPPSPTSCSCTCGYSLPHIMFTALCSVPKTVWALKIVRFFNDWLLGCGSVRQRFHADCRRFPRLSCCCLMCLRLYFQASLLVRNCSVFTCLLLSILPPNSLVSLRAACHIPGLQHPRFRALRLSQSPVRVLLQQSDRLPSQNIQRAVRLQPLQTPHFLQLLFAFCMKRALEQLLRCLLQLSCSLQLFLAVFRIPEVDQSRKSFKSICACAAYLSSSASCI
jgi:hypothetical protein